MAKALFHLFLLLALTSLTGCAGSIFGPPVSLAKVGMDAIGKIDKKLQGVATGEKIHVFPSSYGHAVTFYTSADGGKVINLDQIWSQVGLKAPRFITIADVRSIIDQRAEGALKQAGYTVSFGPVAPIDADLTIKGSIESILENPTLLKMWEASPTHIQMNGNAYASMMLGEVYIKAIITGRDGVDHLYAVTGTGKSFFHVTGGQGYALAMNSALDQVQENLVLTAYAALQRGMPLPKR
jgi:hypothetical protein